VSSQPPLSAFRPRPVTENDVRTSSAEPPQVARRKTVPGTARVGIQHGPLEPEILEVTIRPAGPGRLRFEWVEQGRRVWLTAKDDLGPGEVVRSYRAKSSAE
jgi:hypothetical protein